MTGDELPQDGQVAEAAASAAGPDSTSESRTAPELDLSTIRLTNPDIKSVVANLAEKAEQMLKGDGAEKAVSASDIRAAIQVLAQLDAAMAREKEALLDESPLKKLAQLAEGMNSNNRDLVLNLIDKIKQRTFAEIAKVSQESQITENPSSLEDVLKYRLEFADKHSFYEIGGLDTISFTSLPDLNDFLMSMIGVDLDIIIKNREVWNSGMPRIESKKIPGLVISIYDRLGMTPALSVSEQQIKIDVVIRIRNGGDDPRPLKATLVDSFEEKKPKA